MAAKPRSEEHTSELQSHVNLVCRLLLEKKKHVEEVPGEEVWAYHPGIVESLDQSGGHVRGFPGNLGQLPGIWVGHQQFVFFFNDAAPPEISPLSLRGALPI